MLEGHAIDLAASPSHIPLASVLLQDKLSLQSRDQVLQLITRTAKSRVAISSFPNPEYLDSLLKIGMAKRGFGEGWLHLATFRCEEARPELLAALIAAGCVALGNPAISKTGLVLQEVVRLSLERLVIHHPFNSQPVPGPFPPNIALTDTAPSRGSSTLTTASYGIFSICRHT